MQLSRRMFLASSAAAGVGALSGGLFGGNQDVEGYLSSLGLHPSAAAATSDPVLVLVTLYGGNDGLNTVVPYEDGAYHGARGPLALDPTSVLPLGSGLALHPSLTGLQRLWQQQELAVVLGVGYPDPSFSHFDSMDVWQSGASDPAGTGWLGRWLDATGTDPLRAVSVGPLLPLALQGGVQCGAAVPPPPLVVPGSPVLQSCYAAMQVRSASDNSLPAQVARSDASFLSVTRAIGPVVNRAPTVDVAVASNLEGASESAIGLSQGGGGGTQPRSVLATQLSLVAEMMLAGIPTSVYSVSLGGFDTHTNQLPTQAALLAEVDQAVTGFVQAVASAPRPPVVLVYSEFGRRVRGNASAGSDHGSAGVVFVMGPTVKGGFYGAPPSLSALDDGNLVATTDYRSIYATVLNRVIGVPARSVLGGDYGDLAFL